jgi:hypothetical protein
LGKNRLQVSGLLPLKSDAGCQAGRSKEVPNHSENNKLKISQKLASTSTCTKAPEKGKNHTSDHPADLAEIIAVWPHLPEHIKAAIKALILALVKDNDSE